jgi:hypothetical protein
MVKSFKGFVPSEAVTFELQSPDGHNTVTFRCKPNVPGSKFLEYMSRAESVQDFGAMAKAVRDIIDTALTPESAKEFWAFADDETNGISLDTLSEISGWLAETFAGNRPTVPQPA